MEESWKSFRINLAAATIFSVQSREGQAYGPDRFCPYKGWNRLPE